MIIDLTEFIEEDMPVFPGDPKPKITRKESLDYTIHELLIGTHTGTHIDTPSHFLPNGNTLDKYEISRFIGNALVTIIKGNIPKRPKGVDFLLIYTGSSKKWRKGWKMDDYEQISIDLAKSIVEEGYQLVGIDSPSIGDYEVHKFLLKNDVLIVESLSSNLENLVGKIGKFICLPLKLKGVDGSPVRAIIEIYEQNESRSG